MIENIFLMLIFYQIKHFLADYPLQNGYMLQKFKPGWDFILPLAAHAGVHAFFTFLIVFFFSQSLSFSLAMTSLDFTVHFIMDRVKAGPKYLGRYKALSANEYPEASIEQKRHNTYFWWSLGLDQMVHHFTHYVIIAATTFS